jgi:hypothetical protein
MTVKVRATNTGDQAVTGSLNLRVAPNPFATRQELNNWPERDLEQVKTDAWTAYELAHQRLEPGESREFTLEDTAASMYLGRRGDEPGWGPRGILVDFETAQLGCVAAVRTFVVYAPPEAVTGQVKLALVAGLAAAPGEDREAALARLDSVAVATSEAWISWLLDPSLLTVADNQDAADADRLAGRLRTAVESGKTIYALPYQDLDEVMLAGAGSGAGAAVAAARDLGKRYLGESVGELAAAKIRTDLAWAARPVSAAEAVGMGQAGVSAVLLDPGQLEAAPTYAVTRVGGGPLVAASDPLLADRLTTRRGALDNNLILADLAFAAVRSQVDGEQASLLVTLPRGWDPAQAGGGNPLAGLVGASWVEPTALAGLLNEPAGAPADLGAGAEWPGPPRADLASLLQEIGYETAFASLVEQPGEYLARTLPPLLVPLSNTTQAGAARSEAARTALAGAATALPPVQVNARSDVNLIAEEGMVPVEVQNQSNEAVHGLVVKLTAQTGAIRIPEDTRLDLSPGQSVVARVPVRALANGVFKVEVELLDQAGAQVAAPTSITMRVRAEWETVGTAIVGALFGLVFLWGLVSSVRKRRAAKRRPPAHAQRNDAAGAGQGGGAGQDRGARREAGQGGVGGGSSRAAGQGGVGGGGGAGQDGAARQDGVGGGGAAGQGGVGGGGGAGQDGAARQNGVGGGGGDAGQGPGAGQGGGGGRRE